VVIAAYMQDKNARQRLASDREKVGRMKLDLLSEEAMSSAVKIQAAVRGRQARFAVNLAAGGKVIFTPPCLFCMYSLISYYR
jgi:hypothetical protein